ncbi:hypothetical protein MKW94_016068 [Papaver nudicaule]|uniref:F-box domain-containing protein n=1 Tax=Papaver nudicaule TaxID=74823 RepID=A0AA41VCF2_PAPNU|nr:hypothetical protein [Papaver nudicaule]
MSFAVQSKIEEDGDYDKQMKRKHRTQGRGELVQIDGGDDFHISLPTELILEFLSRLPVKSLRRLSCTSKYLYNTIDKNQHFVKGNSSDIAMV